MAKIIFKDGKEKGREYELLSDVVRIGRAPHNTLPVLDEKVSQEHCVIEKKQSHFYIRDLNSSNGTFLNGKTVTGTRVLSSGDLIKAGDTTLSFEETVHERRPGLTTMAGVAQREMEKKGKGYRTMLAEVVSEVKEKDIKKAKEEVSPRKGTLFQKVIKRFGWGNKEAEVLTKEVRGKKEETFSSVDIISAATPKPGERRLTLRKEPEGIGLSSIVVFQGKDYLVVDVSKAGDSQTVEYCLKEV